MATSTPAPIPSPSPAPPPSTPTTPVPTPTPTPVPPTAPVPAPPSASAAQPQWKPEHGARVTTKEYAGAFTFFGHPRDRETGEFKFDRALLATDGSDQNQTIEVAFDSLSPYAPLDRTQRDEELRAELSKPVPPARGVPKNVSPANAVVALIVAAILPFMFSCSYLTPEQKASYAQLGTSIAAQVFNAAAKLGIAKAAQGLHGNPYADSVAQSLWSLTGQDVINPAQVQALVTQAGNPDEPGKWSAFGKELGTILVNQSAALGAKVAADSAAIAVSQLGTATPPAPPPK